MATRKYMSLERLQEYDALIKAEIANGDASTLTSAKAYVDGLVVGGHNHDDRYYTETEVDTKLSAINTSISNITNGAVAVKEAEHADSADEAAHAASADSATSATKATQDGDGNVITETYQTISDDTLSTTSKEVVGAINELNEYAKIYPVDWTVYEGDTKDVKLYNALEDLSVNTLGIPSISDTLGDNKFFSIVLQHEDLVFRIKGYNGVSAQFDPYAPISVMKTPGSTGAAYCLTGFSINYGYSVLYLYSGDQEPYCLRPIEERVKIKQGAAKAGQYLTVNNEGNVTTTVLPSFETSENAQLKLNEAKAYADTAATQVKNDLLNGAGEAYDTLKELGDLISDNVDAIAALETVATGKADKVHTHAISDVSGLQDVLDVNSEAITELTETIENVKKDAANQDIIVLSEAQRGIDANADRIEALETVVSNKVDTEHTHSWNDLEDRPFYDAGYSEQVILENYTSESYENEEHPKCNFIPGEKYNVIWNGVLYENITCESSEGYNYIGEPDTESDTYPFYIDDNGGDSIYIGTNESSYTVSISILVPNVVKIDHKYLHNADWSQNDENAPGYIKNRPFYEIESRVVETIYEGTIPAEDLTYHANGDYYATPSSKQPAPLSSFVEGIWYEVIFNGTTYSTLCRRNYYLMIGNEGFEPCPFNIYYYDNTNTLYIKCKEQGPITLKISVVDPAKIVQLDTKYLPFVTKSNTNVLSWDGNTNGYDGYYKDSKYFKISNQVITEQNIIGGAKIKLSDGEVIEFTADDDTVYTFTDDSGLVVSLNAYVHLTRDGIYFVKYNDGLHVASLEINEFNGFAVETIKSSYINAYTREESDVRYQPKITDLIDWEQNDESAINYVKNRTHYKEIGELVTLFENTVTTKGVVTSRDDVSYYTNNTTIPSSVKFDQNKVYVVTFDEKQYVLTPKYEYGTTYIGNAKYVANYDDSNSHLSFAIFNYNNQTILHAGYGDHTVKIEEADFIYHQLDEKYIPDTIARIEDIKDVDLTSYQTKADEALNTTDKTIVGAINELNTSISNVITEAEVDAKLENKANATHIHAISDITDLETTLANATSAITANTNSISAHSTSISNLQTAINNIQEITSADIQALFAPKPWDEPDPQ